MNAEIASPGIVLFADVIRSQRDAAASTSWLRSLRGELNERYGHTARAPFEFTQGDELQGLLEPDGDPFLAIIVAALHPESRPMRWAVQFGEVEPGRGPATHRSGGAFVEARALIETARKQRDTLLAVTGEERADRLLAAVAPVLGALFAELTPTQRRIGRLALLDDLRQAEIAERLHVSPPNVSVSLRRGRIRSIQRLLDAVRELYAEGTSTVGRSAGSGSGMAPSQTKRLTKASEALGDDAHAS